MALCDWTVGKDLFDCTMALGYGSGCLQEMAAQTVTVNLLRRECSFPGEVLLWLWLLVWSISMNNLKKWPSMPCGYSFYSTPKALTTKVASGFKGTQRRKISWFTTFDILVSKWRFYWGPPQLATDHCSFSTCWWSLGFCQQCKQRRSSFADLFAFLPAAKRQGHAEV